MKTTLTVCALLAVLLLGGCGTGETSADTSESAQVSGSASASTPPTGNASEVGDSSAPTADPTAELEAAAGALLSSMANRDFAAMSQWVDPDLGVTFTPYSAVDAAVDRTVSAVELAAFDTDPEQYLWGSYDGSGNPIELTCRDYWDRFVWNTDYTEAPTVSINQIAQSGVSMENVQEAYPDAEFVEYHFDALLPEYGGVDWCSLKLVFHARDGAWKLIGVIHSEWTA